jgi:hypothetical protein
MYKNVRIIPFQELNAKKERNQLILAQIALAEESARLRRKEKREKKRMELSKYLGINAWKCDQVTQTFEEKLIIKKDKMVAVINNCN